MNCIYCNGVIAEGMNFCTSCGKPVDQLAQVEKHELDEKEAAVIEERSEIEASETIENSETIETPDPVMELESIEESDPVLDAELIEESVPIIVAEPIKEVKAKQVSKDKSSKVKSKKIKEVKQKKDKKNKEISSKQVSQVEGSVRRKKIRRKAILITLLVFIIVAGSATAAVMLLDINPFDTTSSKKDKEKDASDEEEVVAEALDSIEDGEDYTVEGLGTIHFNTGSLAMKTEVSFKTNEEFVNEGLMSSLYEITLDDVPKGNIQVDLLIPEGVDPEQMLVGIEVEGYTQSLDTTELNYIYLVPEVVADGYATVTISPDCFTMVDDSEGKVSNKHVVYAAGKKTYRMRAGFFDSEFWYDGGNFRVVNEKWIGSLSAESGKALLDDLEFMHQYFLDKGYNYDLRNNWPFYVYIKSIDAQGGYVLSKSAYLLGKDPDRGWIELNNSFFKDGYTAGELKPLIGHEWFHMIQNNYYTASETYWFDEATACYFEAVFLGGVPSITAEYWEKAYESIFPRESNGSEGYARQPLAQFLANEYQEPVILKIYQELKDGSDLKGAISIATGVSFSELINPYYVALATGEIGTNNAYTINKNILNGDSVYGTLGSKLKLEAPDFGALTKDELLLPIEIGEISETINGEGCRIVSLEMDDVFKMALNDNTVLSIESEPGVQVNLIRIKSKDTVVESAQGGLYNIKDIKKYVEDSWQYMVLLVNTDTTNQDVTMTVEMTSVPTLAELEGKWLVAELTITELYISDEFMEMIAGFSEEMISGALSGCEVEGENGVSSEVTVDSIDSIEGQSFPIELNIVRLSDTTGTLAFSEAGLAGQVDEEDESMSLDPTPFTYDNGIIYCTFEEEGAVLEINLQAFYSGLDQVGVEGTFYVNYGADMLYIDANIKGEKEITKTTP